MPKHIKKLPNFFMDFFVEQKVPEIYAKVSIEDKTIYTTNDPIKNIIPLNGAYSIALIPEYLDIELVQSKTYDLKTYKQTNFGYGVRITEGFNINSYLKQQLRGNLRNVKKRQSRLETCYNIDYRFFYGKIDVKNYQYLMQCLYDMLVRRFDQRNDVNEKLNDWKELVAATREKVLQKKASLFVIYDDGVPIDISLNYHYQYITFGAISSYDIDYSKFGLGAIEKIKILDWCVENGYTFLDFGYGDLEYKRTWSNYIYNFKYQVIYNNNSFLLLVLVNLELIKLRIKEYLKSKKVDVLYRKFKAKLSSKRIAPSDKFQAVTYDKCTLIDLSAYTDIGLEKIDYHIETQFPFKSIINDFIYATSEKKNSVSLLKVSNEPNTFLVKGEKVVHKITFKD